MKKGSLSGLDLLEGPLWPVMPVAGVTTEAHANVCGLGFHVTHVEVWAEESWPQLSLAVEGLSLVDGFQHGCRWRKTHPPSGAWPLGI